MLQEVVETLRAPVMPGQELAFVLEGVPEGDVGDVVGQGGEEHRLLVDLREPAGALRFDLSDDALGHPARAHAVLEAGVLGAGVDVEGGPQLPYAPQALHLGRVNDL